MYNVKRYIRSLLVGFVGGIAAEGLPYVAAYLVPGSDPYRFIEERFTAMGANAIVGYFEAVIVVSFVIFLIFLITPLRPKIGGSGARKALAIILQFAAWDIGMIGAVGVWVLVLIALVRFMGPAFF